MASFWSTKNAAVVINTALKPVHTKVFLTSSIELAKSALVFPRGSKEMWPCASSPALARRLHDFCRRKKTRGQPLDYIIKFRKLALPCYPQFEPVLTSSTYSARPRSFPGTDVRPSGGSQEDVSQLKEPQALLEALMLFGASPRIITRYEVRRRSGCRGWSQSFAPFTEPTYFRKHYDETHGAYRHNAV
jgi:hypothetical protein